MPPQAGRRAAYAKVTARSADDWPALGIAVSVGRTSDVRIADRRGDRDRDAPAADRSACSPARRLDDALLREAGRCAAAEAPVVGDLHGSAAYKRVLVEVHLRRALQRALAA